jgi:hypothetical protein
MLLFRSEEHVARSGKPAGAFLTPEQMWRIADTWYHDRADSAWRRRSAEEAEALFASVGLTGEFWRLRI